MKPLFVGLNNLLMAYEDKSAYALCAFSFALGPDAEPVTFLGKTPRWRDPGDGFVKGSCWFGVVLKSFEISVKQVKGKTVGKIVERGSGVFQLD
ncbi:Inosine triphosphate pyrophosphatase [Vitis vinifera]|uniref:Inosine triphosphate pyrophosphatase n=1 Tax=Vitis vinifera TaxID=29760 RepID=A0A438HVI0_VITVI|nr:Inosine triphosphate pyrophosphatase [Vitis vinifera]